MVTRPRGTLQGVCLFFSQPAALPPLALRAALACVLVTWFFSAAGAHAALILPPSGLLKWKNLASGSA